MHPIFFETRFQGAVSFIGTRLCCLGYDQPNGGGPLLTQHDLDILHRTFTGRSLWL